MTLRVLVPMFIFMTPVEIYKGWFSINSVIGFVLGLILYRLIKYLLWNVKSFWIFALIDLPILCLSMWLAKGFDLGWTFMFYILVPLGLPLIAVFFGTFLGFCAPQKFYEGTRLEL